MQAATTEIRATTVDELRQHAGALIVAHWQEVERHIQPQEPSPDWERLELLETAGCLIALGLWDGERLAGYSVTIIGEHLHYAGINQASVSAFFVDREHRHSGAGRQLLGVTVTEARERGAHEVTWHAKPGSPMARLLASVGAEVTDHNYRMRV